MIKRTAKKSIRSLTRLRKCSSSSTEEQPGKYLATWLGQHNSNAAGKTTFSNDLNSLNVRNSSFFLPTLTLNRSDTPSSLKSHLEAFFGGSTLKASPAIRSMLHSKHTLLRKGQNKEEKVIWKTPVILDLKAFQHCGSPHFKPLAYGALKDFVGVLSDWGIEVIGVTNITRNKVSTNQYTNTNESTTKTSEIGTDIEAAQLELPILMGKTGRSLANSRSLGIENLILSISIWNNLISSHMADTTNRSSTSFAGKESDLLLEQLKSFSTSTFKNKDINRRAIRTKNKPIDSSVIIEESQQLNMSATNVMNEVESLPSEHKIYRGSVRSGQQISTDKPNQSLIVIGNVNSGGEVMADGDIHVYGTLRGRALAGLSPNKSKGSDAKIFASIFDAELVCIGQTFTTVDSLEDLGLESYGGAIVSFGSCKGNLCFEGF